MPFMALRIVLLICIQYEWIVKINCKESNPFRVLILKYFLNEKFLTAKFCTEIVFSEEERNVNTLNQKNYSQAENKTFPYNTSSTVY